MLLGLAPYKMDTHFQRTLSPYPPIIPTINGVLEFSSARGSLQRFGMARFCLLVRQLLPSSNLEFPTQKVPFLCFRFVEFLFLFCGFFAARMNDGYGTYGFFSSL